MWEGQGCVCQWRAGGGLLLPPKGWVGGHDMSRTLHVMHLLWRGISLVISGALMVTSVGDSVAGWLRQRRQRGECHPLVLNGRCFLWTLAELR